MSIIAASGKVFGAGGLIITDGGGSQAPVTNLRMAQQGGTNNSTSPVTNSQKLAWTAAPGATSYLIERNVDNAGWNTLNTTSSTNYTDSTATNSNDANYQAFLTQYAYRVTAIGPGGSSTPVYPSMFFMENGVATQGQADFSYGIPPATQNWNGTLGGRNCVVFGFSGGGFQPVSDPPIAGTWDLDWSFGYTKWTMDVYLQSPIPDFNLGVGMARRIPLGAGGDAFGWQTGPNILDGTWGTTPVANTWQTYVFDVVNLGFGSGTITAGSITGSTLTVTSYSGPNIIQAGARISGAGIPANTIIQSHNQSNSVGTFGLFGPGIPLGTPLASIAGAQYQITNAYKPSFGRPSNPAAFTIGFDNFGFIP